MEKIRLKGRLKLAARNIETGEVEQIMDSHNMIVNNALLSMIYLIGDHTDASPIGIIKFGTGTSEPTHTDTDVTNPTAGIITEKHYEDDNATITFDYLLGTADGNGKVITECGLYTESGVLFARRLLPNPINKTASIALEGTWSITFGQYETEETTEENND